MTTHKHTIRLVVGLALASGLLMLGGWLLFLNHHQTKIYPGVHIDQHPVGGLTKLEAADKLATYYQGSELPPKVLTIQVDDITVASSSSQLGLHREYTAALERAYEVGRARSGFLNWVDILRAQFQQPAFETTLSYNPTQVEKMITELKRQVDVLGREPSASLGSSGEAWSLELDAGKIGRQVEVNKTLELIQATATTDQQAVTAPVASTAAELTDAELATARERASHLLGSTLVFRAEGVTITLNDTDLVQMLAFPAGYTKTMVSETAQSWLEQVNRAPQDAVFEYDPESLQVTTFKPDRPGLELDVAAAENLLVSQLSQLEAEAQAQIDSNQSTEPLSLEAQLPVAETEPAVTLAETNDLGIIELIGFGESYYDHSIPSRIHNVSHATERISNTIIPPGAEFSFNKTLGEVSSRTGFRPAYVIKGGRTVLGDGGGVCQVSTTLFRSVLDAGLPITRRLPHSYRVSYYEQGFMPGIDATVYSGDVDLRFVNDTGHHILIAGAADSDNLYMTIEVFGTSDGRTTEITDHKTWGYSPPLPAQYIDDPSLPPGRVKQIDWAASGIKASFTNVVRDANGQIIREEEYTSNYRPWAAKYLRGV